MSKVDIYIHICVYPLLFFSVQIRHYSGHLDVPHLRTNKLRQTNFQRTGCVKQLWKSEDCKSPCRAEGPVNLVGGVLSCRTEGVRSTPGVRGGASPAYSAVPKSRELGKMVE